MLLRRLSAVELDDGGRAYPRPQLRRQFWWSLNGTWEFALDQEGRWQTPEECRWEGHIRVPYAPETCASGVADTGFYRACWYRRFVQVTPPANGARLVLHFGAVDYRATVWMCGTRLCTHRGGYSPFSVDITGGIPPSGLCEIVVHVEDDPADLARPRGKQDWQLRPHSIWYPRTTGIWQTVWLEEVPATHIERMKF